jgi:hypothetical protein
VRHGRHVTDDRVQRNERLVVITEILAPRVDFLLSGRVPRHLAAEWIRLFSPAFGALFHQRLDVVGLFSPAFAFQILKQLENDVAFHQSELDVTDAAPAVRLAAKHELRRLVSLIEIPVPRVISDEAGVVARESIERPVGGDNVRIVVAAPDRFGVGLLPARPCGPVEGGVVLKAGNLGGRVIKKALADTVLVGTIVVLKTAPKDFVDELFVLRDLFAVRLAELFHRGREP